MSVSRTHVADYYGIRRRLYGELMVNTHTHTRTSRLYTSCTIHTRAPHTHTHLTCAHAAATRLMRASTHTHTTTTTTIPYSHPTKLCSTHSHLHCVSIYTCLYPAFTHSPCQCIQVMFDLQANAADYAPILVSSAGAGAPGNQTESVKMLVEWVLPGYLAFILSYSLMCTLF